MTGDREQVGHLRSEVAVRRRPPANGDPANGHPTNDHPATEHPATEHPVTEHPASDHPASDHPADDPAADSAGQPSDLVAGLFRAHAVALVRVATLLLGDQQSAEDLALGISRATVSSTASRALAKLARELKEEP